MNIYHQSDYSRSFFSHKIINDDIDFLSTVTATQSVGPVQGAGI